MEKTKKITKKELYAQIVAKGVDKKIADSLLRANIDTIKFVNDLIERNALITFGYKGALRPFYHTFLFLSIHI